MDELSQRKSVSDYVSEFRNIVPMIRGVNEGELLHHFRQALEPHARLVNSRQEPDAWMKQQGSLLIWITLCLAGDLGSGYFGSPFYGNRKCGGKAICLEDVPLQERLF